MTGTPILVAGHEWGGLNLLAPLLRAWTNSDGFVPSFVGAPEVRRQLVQRVPSLIIAPESDKLSDAGVVDVGLLDSLAVTMLQRGRYDVLLCGTSLHTALEKRLILAARAAGIPSIA